MSDVIKEMLVRLTARDQWMQDMYGSVFLDPGHELPAYDLHKLYDLRLEPRNYPVQGVGSELVFRPLSTAIELGSDLVYFRSRTSPEQEAQLKAHYAKMDEFMYEVDRKLFEETGQVWNRELLQGSSSTATEMSLRIEDVSSSLNTFLESWNKSIRDFDAETEWTVEGYLIIYIGRRPRVLHYGWGGPRNSYKEELSPKRFRSTRQARKWARLQIGCYIMSIMLQPFRTGPKVDLTFENIKPGIDYEINWGSLWPHSISIDLTIKP